MKKIIFLSILAFILPLSGADETFTVTGTGLSPKAAIREALISALEQKCGLNITAAERSQLAAAESFTAENDNETRKITTNDALTGEIRTLSQGRISGYSEVSRTYDSTSKKYTVVLQVKVPGKYVVGLDPDNRRRMAVGEFRTNTETVSIFGQTIQTSSWLKHFNDALTTHLTQSRKFTMLDRNFDAEVNAELARLSAANAAPTDAVRLNQKLGTDYLVVGTVTFSDIASPGVNPFTGQPLPLSSAVFATIHCRVLLAPTGQLKWADSLNLDILQYAADLNSAADAAAATLAAALLENILPFEIVTRTADGTFVIGEGGKSLVPGEYLSVYALGEEVRDSRTGEILDVVEMRVGMVQVIRVTPKLSYALAVEGDASKMKNGSRLRRDAYSAQAVRDNQVQAAPQAMPTTVQSSGNGGVVVPF